MILPHNNGLHIVSEGLVDHDVEQIFIKLGGNDDVSVPEPPHKRRRILVTDAIDNVSRSRDIEFLDLSMNTGIRGSALRFHLLPPSIRSLRLHNCPLSTEGVKALCEYMETNTSLTSLTFGTVLNVQVLKAVSNMLSRNDTLKHLGISGEDCDDFRHPVHMEGLRYLREGLKHNHTLVRLTGFRFSDYESLRCFLQIFIDGGGSAIEHLDMDLSLIEDDHEKTLKLIEQASEMVKKCKRLTSLGSENPIGYQPEWDVIKYLLQLNFLKLTGKEVTRRGSANALVYMLEKANKCKNHDCIFYMLQRNSGRFGN